VRLVADSGLWSIGPVVAPTPLVAVLEVSGAVLSWTVDDPFGSEAPRITFTDPRRADWLWRILGESGHLAVVSALEGRSADEQQTVEVPGINVPGINAVPGTVERLRRLALGHWLRRWWPASDRDGIARLDRALLDAEIALCTAAAQEFFTDDTLDSDVGELLGPHATSLTGHVRGGDPRVLQLVRACSELADEVGISGWSEVSAALDGSTEPATPDRVMPLPRRDDYALAAGSDTGRPDSAAIARGVASINWGAVPPGIFDAAEDTVDWTVEATDSAAVAVVRAAMIGPQPAAGIAVRVRCGAVDGTGVLQADGRATVPLVDSHRQPMTESAAWNHDWRSTSVTIGADVEESRRTRDQIRQFARARLHPASDAFLAEILAAESEY
jgi:hypothetical protein